MRMIVNEPLSFFGLESGRARKVRRPNRVKSPTTGNQKCFFCRSEMNNSCKKKNSMEISRKSVPSVVIVIGFSRMI